MWNIGVLIYVLVTGHTPFGGTTKLDTQNNITHCVLDFPKDLFEKISNQCMDLIQHLIVRMPKYDDSLFLLCIFSLSLFK
jgi:serine/threonine protein kinase